MSLRDCKAWIDCGMKMTTTSDEACKLFDSAISQLVDRKVGPYGDLGAVFPALMAADPDFVMGNTLIFTLTVAETNNSRSGEMIQSKARHLRNLVEKQDAVLTDREKRHAASALYMADSMWTESISELTAILTEFPRDMFAIKLFYLYCLYSGNFEEMRDIMARVLPEWREDEMEYGYLLGMYAFALQETHFYEKGTTEGKKALAINPKDTWATHTMSHIYLCTGQNNTGLDFMQDTVANWEWDGGLACHNFWHTALFHVEKGDFNSALEVYDQEIAKRANADKTMFQMTDGVSLLYRLRLEGVEPGRERWADMLALCEPHIGDHTTCFNDLHIMFAACSNQRNDLSRNMLDSMTNMIKGEKNYIQQTTQDVNLAICQAISEFENKSYDRVVELIRPVRYRTAPIGGSGSQRDVINMLLLHSAIKSNKPSDNMYAKQLLLERKSLQEETPMADRLLTRMAALS